MKEVPRSVSVAVTFSVLVVTAIYSWATLGTGGETVHRMIPFYEENPAHPELMFLRDEEKLDTVIAGARDRFDAMKRLRHWARVQWKTQVRGGSPEPRWNSRRILQLIRSGDLPGGLCSEYATVYMQACVSLGWTARGVSIESDSGAGHRVVEVWNPETSRWVLMDPIHDLHFERQGLPMTALDLHKALIAGETSGISAISSTRQQTTSNLLPYYRHVTLFMRNNHLTHPSPVINDWCVGFVDDSTTGRPEFSGHLTREPETYYRPPEFLRPTA